MESKNPSLPSPPSRETPKKKPDDPAEERAEARRAREAEEEAKRAEAEAQRQIDEAKARHAAEEKKKKLGPVVARQCAGARQPVELLRLAAQAIEARAKAFLVTAGNLEGAILTAQETARTDPERAMGTLDRAAEAFEKDIKQLDASADLKAASDARDKARAAEAARAKAQAEAKAKHDADLKAKAEAEKKS